MHDHGDMASGEASTEKSAGSSETTRLQGLNKKGQILFFWVQGILHRMMDLAASGPAEELLAGLSENTQIQWASQKNQ